jgi:hypothetical protein
MKTEATDHWSPANFKQGGVPMKIFLTVLFGVINFVAIMMLMFVASIILRVPESTGNTYLVSTNAIVAALPAGVIAFFLARVLKIAGIKAGLLSGAIWAGTQLVLFSLIGWANQTLPFIFSAFGFYVLIVFVFLGPVISALTIKPTAGT